MAVEHELMEHARKLARDEMFAAEKKRVEALRAVFAERAAERRKHETEIDVKVERLLALVDLDPWDFKTWLERELGG